MADTLGSIVDKIATLNQKMFVNQDLFYKVRKMSFEEFSSQFIKNEDGAKLLWSTFKLCMDLNVQRSALITEFDKRIVELIETARLGQDLDNGRNIQDQHKTY